MVCLSQSIEIIKDSNDYNDYRIVEDHLTLKKINEINEIKYSDSINFDKEFLIHHTVWIDCSGTFYIKTDYDSVKNTLTCKLYIQYGGSRGMCRKDNFIKINKTKTGMKIIFIEYRVK